MIKNIHIFDIDGTLVDSSHRYRTIWNGSKITIDLPHWKANEKHFAKDTLLPLAERFAELNKDPETYTIWITARTRKHLTESFDWLVSKMGQPNKWFCRPDGSMESGAVLKTKQLNSIMNLKQFQKANRFFYEDNKDYLDAVCSAIDAVPVYVESNQGY